MFRLVEIAPRTAAVQPSATPNLDRYLAAYRNRRDAGRSLRRAA